MYAIIVTLVTVMGCVGIVLLGYYNAGNIQSPTPPPVTLSPTTFKPTAKPTFNPTKNPTSNPTGIACETFFYPDVDFVFNVTNVITTSTYTTTIENQPSALFTFTYRRVAGDFQVEFTGVNAFTPNPPFIQFTVTTTIPDGALSAYDYTILSNDILPIVSSVLPVANCALPCLTEQRYFYPRFVYCPNTPSPTASSAPTRNPNTHEYEPFTKSPTIPE